MIVLINNHSIGVQLDKGRILPLAAIDDIFNFVFEVDDSLSNLDAVAHVVLGGVTFGCRSLLLDDGLEIKEVEAEGSIGTGA